MREDFDPVLASVDVPNVPVGCEEADESILAVWFKVLITELPSATVV